MHKCFWWWKHTFWTMPYWDSTGGNKNQKTVGQNEDWKSWWNMIHWENILRKCYLKFPEQPSLSSVSKKPDIPWKRLYTERQVHTGSSVMFSAGVSKFGTSRKLHVQS